jgi:hydrogenase expression/formation protein HypC
MCLAIPGKVVTLGPGEHLATVEVSSVRRKVNIDLLAEEGVEAGDWVLIHVGFAMSRISALEAEQQLRLLAMLGEDEEAMKEIESYSFGGDGSGEEGRGEGSDGGERSAEGGETP